MWIVLSNTIHIRYFYTIDNKLGTVVKRIKLYNELIANVI